MAMKTIVIHFVVLTITLVLSFVIFEYLFEKDPIDLDLMEISFKSIILSTLVIIVNTFLKRNTE